MKTVKRVLAVCAVGFGAMVCEAETAAKSPPFRLETRESFGGRLAWGQTPIAATADGVTTGSVTVAGGGVAAPLWDTAAQPDGWHDVTLAGVTNGATARLATLNGPGAVVREGTLTNDATWASNAVQVVRHWVVVPSGRTLTLAGAVVKFCDGTGIQVDAGGTLNAVGAILTHVADDTAGGDTNMDGSQTAPQADRWRITGAGQINMDAATEDRWGPPTVTSGTISGAQIWRGGRVYLVNGNVTVASGATLTVQPGAVVKFATGTSLLVSSGGTLNAAGNRARPIVFTSAKDDTAGGDTNGDGAATAPQPGDWVAIRNNGGTALLEYATVTYGGFGQFANQGDGIIRSQSGTTTLRGCTVAGSNLRLLSAQGGTLTAENCILRDGQWGIDGGGAVTFVNGVIDDCQIGMNGGTVVNTVIHNCITGRSGGTARYSCLWNSGGTLPGAGNRVADPRFTDVANGDYTLLAGSPCIDAGDGVAAPERDYFGQPRMDVRGVPDTGVATANRVCPDIGIYEYPGVGGGPAPDLAVVGVSAPASVAVGEALAVQWSVANVGAAGADGSWRDMVALVSDDGVGSVELGTAVSSATLAPGATNAFTASFTVPPNAEGVWRVRVQANAYRDIYEGTLTSNNVLTATATTTVSVPASDPTAGVSGTAQSGRPYATSVTFDGAHSMVGRIQAPAGTVVYYGIGFMPTVSAYSGRAVCDANGGVIGLPATDQRIYLLVVSEESTPQAFTVTFESGELVVRSVSPGTVPRSGTTSLRVTGANFAEGCTVSFVHGGQTVAATNVTMLSGEALTAEVDCGRLTAGARYGVRVTAGANTAELADALTVQAAAGKAELACSLTVPDSVREGRTFLLYINYENTGNLDMPAPVFTVQAAGLNFTVDGNTYSNSVKVLGLSAAAPVGTLRPGEPQRLAVQAQVRPGTRSVTYTLLKDYAGSAASKARLPLALFFSEDWIHEHDAADDALIAALQAGLGATWEAFYGNLGAYATEQHNREISFHDFESLSRGFAWACYWAASVEADTVAESVAAQELPRSLLSAPAPQPAAAGEECTCGNGELLIDKLIELQIKGGFEPASSQAELRYRVSEHNKILKTDHSDPGDVWILVADGTHAFWPAWHRLVDKTDNVSQAFNQSRRTVIIVHGNLHSVHSKWVRDMAWAWKAREPDSNVLAVDWGDDATGGFLPEFAFKTAADIPRVARIASDILRKASIVQSTTVILGHSHGGHVAGHIAQHLGGVARLIGLETSSMAAHLLIPANSKYPNAWNKRHAQQVEFYKSSYQMSMGTGGIDIDAEIFGHYNFMVIPAGDRFEYQTPVGISPLDWLNLAANNAEGRLRAARHDAVCDWFTATIGDASNWADIGYGWNGQSSWRAHGLSSGDAGGYEKQYHGVINVGRKSLELAKPSAGMEWQYPEDILIGLPRMVWGFGRAGALDRLQQNVTRAVEYRLGALSIPDSMRTGEDVLLSFGSANEADNFSIDYDDVDKLFGRARNDSGGPWTQGMTDGVWLCRKADGSGLGEQVSLIDLVDDGYEWTPVNTWAINNLAKFNRPGRQRTEPRTLTLPTTYGGQKLTEPTEFWLVAGTAMQLQEDQKPWAYLGDLCPTNNYLIQKVTIDPGSNCVARIAVNGAAVSDGERSAVVYVGEKATAASVALSGSGSERGSSAITTYRWTASSGTVGSPTSVSTSLSVPLPSGTDQRLVTVTLTITDANGLTDTAWVIVPVRREAEDPDGEIGDQDRSTVPQSFDPNEVAGPLGFGDPETQRFVTPGQWLDYTVFFENLTNATASAQEVFVTNPLSEYLDWETFEMGEVAFHNQVDLGLSGKRNGRSEAALEGTAFSVRTEVAVDTVAGVASWYLRIVDPDTIDSWPADPYAGFLPPNDETHRGEGHLAYRVKVRADAPFGVVISNAAMIVFDYNEPIVTDPSWWNTVAADRTFFLCAEKVVGEGDGTVELAVYGGGSTGISSVAYWLLPGTAKAGTDYIAPKTQPQRIAWTNTAGERTIMIPIKADALVEDDETFYVLLGDPVNCELGEPRVCKVTITDANSGLTLADALDNVLLKWTTGGAAKWVPQTVVTADGVDAAASGAMAAGKAAHVQATASGAGTLRFAWSVSGAGVLRLYDGKAVLAATTNATAWETRTLTLPQTGAHTLKWEFANTGGTNSFAYLDQVVWLPGGAAGVAVTAAPSDPRGGTASGTGVYYAGAKVPLNAAARPGWLFAGWTPANLFAKPLTAAQTLTLGGSAVAVTAQFVKVPVVTGLPNPPEGGSVSGSGLCLPGKTVKLTAKAAKGWWFMRWSDGAQTAARTVAAAEDVTLHAVFKRIAEIAPPTLSNPGPRQAMVGVAYLQVLAIASECLPTVKVTGLPAGLKYDAAARAVTGVPSKAGVFTTTFSASNPGGSAAAVAFPITVAPLSAWAQGGFGGAAGTAAHGGGSASLSVTALGKVSGKLTLRGTNVTFSAASYAGRDGDGAFLIAATAKVGKASWPLEMRVFTPELTDPEGIAPATLSKAEGTLAGGGWLALWRNVWQDPGMAAVLTNGVAGYYTATLPGGAEHGSGYLTMTVDKAGGVKTAGKLADGTAVSLSGPLLLDEAGRLFTVLYTAPKAYAGGGLYGLAEFFRAGGGARTLVRPLDGEPFAWESLSPQATAIYGEGFWRELGVDGGWYDTLGNLYDHYRDRDLSVGTDEGAPAPVLTVGTTQYASVWWRPDGLALSAVTNKSGVMTGLAAPKVGAPVDPEKDGTWDYGATNTVGLTITLTRPTGIFKGSFKAWFDYAATHTSKPLAFEGVLTPERADPDDGIAGRGYFLWPDQAWYDTGKLDRAGAPVLKAYKYNLSYDFLLLAE